ncbi:hypothetical protein ACTWLT_26905 [Micromonospora sp. ZYX-F-536]|uniref:hypothetical protein n=1 Tax=Micromonospora sp. ZYX-F-536 TaxID=3457629 RepID=UPI0040407CDB
MNRRRPSRTFLRVFSMFSLVFATSITVIGAWSITDERRGSEAVADVLEVEHRGARTFLTVRFTTNRGEVCESSLRATVDANQAVSTGQRIRVHYAKSDPCLRVREVGDHSGWFILLIAVVLLIAFAILAHVSWRRPRPPIPLRYAGMP